MWEWHETSLLMDKSIWKLSIRLHNLKHISDGDAAFLHTSQNTLLITESFHDDNIVTVGTTVQIVTKKVGIMMTLRFLRIRCLY